MRRQLPSSPSTAKYFWWSRITVTSTSSGSASTPPQTRPESPLATPSGASPFHQRLVLAPPRTPTVRVALSSALRIVCRRSSTSAITNAPQQRLLITLPAQPIAIGAVAIQHAMPATSHSPAAYPRNLHRHHLAHPAAPPSTAPAAQTAPACPAASTYSSPSKSQPAPSASPPQITSAAARPRLHRVAAKYSPFAVVTVFSAATSTPAFFANATAAGVGHHP